MFFFKQKKSITVRCSGPNDEIYIDDDPRFTGSGECNHCDYFPCKVNKWYGKKKKIQNCKIFNKFPPAGKIIDLR